MRKCLNRFEIQMRNDFLNGIQWDIWDKNDLHFIGFKFLSLTLMTIKSNVRPVFRLNLNNKWFKQKVNKNINKLIAIKNINIFWILNEIPNKKRFNWVKTYTESDECLNAVVFANGGDLLGQLIHCRVDIVVGKCWGVLFHSGGVHVIDTKALEKKFNIDVIEKRLKVGDMVESDVVIRQYDRSVRLPVHSLMSHTYLPEVGRDPLFGKQTLAFV